MRTASSDFLPSWSLGTVLLLGLASLPARAQILPDTTLPNNSMVLPNGNVFTIDGGTQAGTNLFHSFQEFSIPTSGEAVFNNALTIENIITRVTGGNLSDIDGLIRANGTANLFLINPNGIQFGPNARMEIGGSFLGSTAESLLFEDGSFYSATETDAPPLLSVNVPVGLQMGSNPGAIQVSGSGHNLTVDPFAPLERNDTPTGLEVTPGNTLALVGGSITLDGGILTAQSGGIELSAVAGNSQNLAIERTEAGFALDYSQVQQFGDIQLLDRAFIDASGTGGDDLRLRGRNISLRDSSAISHDNLGTQPMGHLDLQASESIELINDDPNVPRGNIIFSDAVETGRAGNISISAPRLTLQGNSNIIRSLTFGEADGGNIDIETADLSMMGGDLDSSVIVIRTFGAGNGGNLTVDTQRLRLDGSSIVNNVNGGSGSAGKLTIRASESMTVSGLSVIGSSAVSAVGNAGEITVTTPRLIMRDGATISSSTFGAGQAGSIRVNASEFIQVEGSGLNPFTNFFEPSQIRSAGILLPEFTREPRGLPDTITGNAGNVILNTPRLQVSEGATVTVRHESVGDGGILQVNADEILLDTEGSLTASTISGEGGNIELQVRDSLQLRDGAVVDAESFGIGNGGNIAIDSDTIALLENSEINASAFEGTGGNIDITTSGLFVSPNSQITASSQFGIDGRVSVNNPIVDPASGLVVLESDPLNPNTQIQDSCEIATKSRFTIVGSGGLPEDPTQSLQTHTVWRDTRLGEIPTHITPNLRETEPEEVSVSPAPLVEATGWKRNERGQIELVAASGNPSYSSWQPHPECESLPERDEPDSWVR